MQGSFNRLLPLGHLPKQKQSRLIHTSSVRQQPSADPLACSAPIPKTTHRRRGALWRLKIQTVVPTDPPQSDRLLRGRSCRSSDLDASTVPRALPQGACKNNRNTIAELPADLTLPRNPIAIRSAPAHVRQKPKVASTLYAGSTMPYNRDKQSRTMHMQI